MLVAPFNDLDAVARLIREHRDELAGVIVEPFQRIIPPAPGLPAGPARTSPKSTAFR